MALTDIIRWSVTGLLSLILAWAAISDIRDRRIPNWTVLAILGLFLPWALINHGPWALWALAGGVIALVLSFALYAIGWVGAGDSKMFAAVALFVGLGHLAQLAVITTIVGGLIAAVSLASRPRRAMVLMTMKGKGDFGRGVPYGVAIAIGTAVILWSGLLGVPLPEQI